MSASKRILPLTPWSAPHPWSPRSKSLVVLCCTLILCGVGEGMLITAQLGSASWTVLSQGIARQTGWGIGMVTFLISIAVLASWRPLQLKPGLGTVLNIIIIAIVLGLFVQLVTPPTDLVWQVALCIGGIVTTGIASAFYLTCYLGAGPRDGLMVGLCRISGWRVGLVRTLMEGTVCLMGWLLGGVVGLGTLLFTFGVGWIMQASLQWLAKRYPQ